MAYYKNPVTRYLLRKNIFRRIRGRLSGYYRLLTKDELSDIAFILKGREINTILDVGANIGFVTYQFQKRFPKANIYCFEPNPNVFKQLEKNYFHQDNIHLYKKGIGEKSGEILFHLNANTGTSSFLLPNEYHQHHQAKHQLDPIMVSVTTIDQWAQESRTKHIDILKMDIEGFELNALKGAERMLTQQEIDIIYTEVNIVPSYENQALFHDITKYLEERNYHLYNLSHFISQETPIRQATIGNATFLSSFFRKQLEEEFGKDNCGW